MQIGILILLVFACALIALPFIGLLLWSMILAVMLYPLHKWFKRKIGKDYARYHPSQTTEIADNLLLYQRDNGGWIENRDPARILGATEKAALVA